MKEESESDLPFKEAQNDSICNCNLMENVA